MGRARRISVSRLIKDLAATEDGGSAMLAVRLGVSPSTLGRWERGKNRPQPEMESRIRSLAAKRGLTPDDVQLPLFSQGQQPSDKDLRGAFARTFRQIRELLHSVGRLSSRHEALDEVAKLIFSHVMSIDTGGHGITAATVPVGTNSARNLKKFVQQAFHDHLPVCLSHEIAPSDFALRMKDSESTLANGLIEAFTQLANTTSQHSLNDLGSADLMNDAFGQFIVDSFSDEKELGQYLTPPEIVRFMVRLGIHSLLPEHSDALLDPHNGNSPLLILDPSCGVGSFLAESLRVLAARVADAHGRSALPKWTSRTLSRSLVGVDKSERMIRLALTNLALFGAPMANLHLANALDRTGKDGAAMAELEGRAALILTNPPFGAEFHRDGLTQYQIASRWSNGNGSTIDSELLFVERYLDWLAPGGVLVAIVPDSILTNQGMFRRLREGISPSVELLSVISLPHVTFAAAGTNTKTSILHLRKTETRNKNTQVYFGICDHIGFDVVRRGTQRCRVPIDENELPAVLEEATGVASPKIGVAKAAVNDEPRWDATFHAGLPNQVDERLKKRKRTDVTVADVAELVNERLNPSRLGAAEFQYIEISDLDPVSASVRAKPVACDRAPTRARKLVSAGDVLVSTVRPERRAVGVVPEHLDGAVCSTGIAVVRPKAVAPVVLARALQSDFVNVQLLRHNVGIAYPAIDEACLPGLVLPLRSGDLEPLRDVASAVSKAQINLLDAQDRLTKRLDEAFQSWLEG